MQSAQYGAFSDVDMLGNMWNDLATSGDWAEGIMAHSNIPFNNPFSQQHHHYMPNYDLNYASLDDDRSLSFDATMSLETSTDSSMSGSSPGLFSPTTSNALKQPVEVVQTISPLQTNFNFTFDDPQSASGVVDLNIEPQSALSLSSDTTFSQAGGVGSHTRNDSIHSLKREADSNDDDDTNPHSPKKLTTPTRRRRSTLKDTKDADSARAIYLEKNRVAASKCRNKQKREEEKLGS